MTEIAILACIEGIHPERIIAGLAMRSPTLDTTVKLGNPESTPINRGSSGANNSQLPILLRFQFGQR
jgi:hypothetical protein